MKNLILLIVFLVTNGIVQAQVVEWNDKDIDCMYHGYNNVVPLKFVDIAAEKVDLSVSGGELIQNDKGAYVWKSTTSVGTVETLTAKANGKVIGTFDLKFVRLPDPAIQTMPKNASVKNLVGLQCTLPGVKVKVPSYVQSYEIQIINGDDVTILKNKGSVLTPNNRKALKYASSKTQVNLTKVYVRCPGDKAGRRLGDVALQ